MEKKLIVGGAGMEGITEENKAEIRRERLLQK
jgi:hypothetical protein